MHDRVFHANSTGKSNFRDNALKLQQFHVDNRYGTPKRGLKERCKRNPKLFTGIFLFKFREKKSSPWRRSTRVSEDALSRGHPPRDIGT